MAPDSLAAEVLATSVALLTAAATGLLWDRARRWRAWLFRPAAVMLCVSTALLAGAAWVNRSNELYSSWSELFGGRAGVDYPVGGPARADGSGDGAPQPAATGHVVSFVVHGAASGITLPAYAYLPPGYDNGPLSRQQLPVLEAFDGFPGSPNSWLKALLAPEYLDREIGSGRMAPTVVIFPFQTTSANHDSECVNATGGAAIDTFLTTDVRSAVIQRFRVREDAAGWGLIGYSAGAFCAVNLAMRHPDRFAAAVSLSGYFQPYTDAMTGDLFGNDPTARDLNSPLWRLQHLPAPRISLYLAAALDDRRVYSGLRTFAAAVKPPLDVQTVAIPVGGHTSQVWRELQPAAYDWLSAHLAGPAG